MSPKSGWNEIRNVLLVLILFCNVAVVSRNVKRRNVKQDKQCADPVSVPSCPLSTSAWIIQAADRCVESGKYHCLMTEYHNAQNPDLIECCMSYKNITSGHMPRYSKSKDEIQEVECEFNYFMDAQFASNRFRDNGVEHCKYLKTECMMEGMKICNDGTTKTDRMCLCDYKKNYIPEYSLTDGSHCFFVKDNRCYLSNECSNPNQEFNMMYQCVNVCKEGYERPEHSMDCIPIADTTLATTDTMTLPGTGSRPITTKITPGITTGAPTIAPRGKENMMPVIIPVLVTIALAILGLILILLVWYYSNHYPSVVIEKDFIMADKGKDGSIACQITELTFPYKVSKFQWFKYENQHGVHEHTISVGNFKYIGGNLQYPTLVISNIDESDQAFYKCELSYHFRGFLRKIWKKEYKMTSSYTYITVSDSASKLNLNFNSPENVIIGDNAAIHQETKDGTGPSESTYETEPKVPKEHEHIQMTPVPNKEIKVEHLVMAKIGHSVCLRVDLTPEFTVSNVQWFKKKGSAKVQGEQLRIFQRKYKGATPHFPSLVIRKVAKSDEAFYCCRVTADDSEVIKSKDIYLIAMQPDAPGIQNNTWVKRAKNINAGQDVHKPMLKDCSSSSDGDSDDAKSDNSKNSSDSKESKDSIPKDNENPTSPDDIDIHNMNNSTMKKQQPKQDKSRTHSISDLMSLAHQFGCEVEDVAKDGNCFYHAVVSQMPDNLNIKTVEELKTQMINFLRNNDKSPTGELYSKFIDKDRDRTFTDYLNRLAKPREYAEEICLTAVSHCFKVKIRVLSTGDPREFIDYIPNSIENPPTIYLGHIVADREGDGAHYVRLNPLGDSTGSEPNQNAPAGNRENPNQIPLAAGDQVTENQEDQKESTV